MKHYTKDMREWAAKHRTEGNVVAASDLECAADHMDRLINSDKAQKDFILMVLQSVKGGGPVVTFSLSDIEEMKNLTHSG